MIKLSIRMKAVAGQVTGGTVCEIGCDHGKILASLVEKGLVKNAIFADVSAPSLEKARNLTEALKLKNCKFIVSDGFEGINENIDETIIAGMGGCEIVKIIKQAGAAKCNRFVLQPNKDVIYLRKELMLLGHRILADFVVEEKGKFYFILKTDRTSGKLSRKEQLLGLNSLKEYRNDYIKYLEYEKAKCENILEQTNNEEINEKLQIINKELRNNECRN